MNFQYSRDQECGSLEFLRLRAATFEVELEKERRRCLETGESMPQEWTASLKRERQDILEEIQRYESQVDESASPPSIGFNPVHLMPAPHTALGLGDDGRNSVPPHVHRGHHIHPRPATVHPLSAVRQFPPVRDSHAPDFNTVFDATDHARCSSRRGKRGVHEHTVHEGSERKQLSGRDSAPKLSYSSQPIPRPFLLPKSPDGKVVNGSLSKRTTNMPRRHQDFQGTPIPLSGPNRSDTPTPGISQSGRRSARGWYPTALQQDPLKENHHRFLLSSSSTAGPQQKQWVRSIVIDENDKPVFTDDESLLNSARQSPIDPFRHEPSSVGRMRGVSDGVTFNTDGPVPVPLGTSHCRAEATDFDIYRSPASAATFTPSPTHDEAVEGCRLINSPLQMANICRTLKDVFRDLAKYKQFLSYRDRTAQSLLNFLQTMLDYSQLEEGFRRILLIALLRLVRKSNLYPNCFALTGVTRDGEPVADGGYGEIYKGYFRGRLVCLKVVRMYEKSNQVSLYKAFSREAVLWGQLSHINVLPFYGICWLEDARQRIALVSPWMAHGNVNEFLKQNPDADRRLLVMDVAAGMSYLHNHCVTHGDLKGSNILVTESKRACLADFGFSSVMDSQGLKTPSLSSALPEGGTGRFQAPELIDPQFEGSKSQASDIYAFGLVCYEIFTGNIPFYDIPNIFTVMLKVSFAQ